ncbi:MAG: hypothetical protein K1X83_05770 [Oligoflexia bacterium]|nr:hypothetical protein [Oligoflexia bacterium]
MSSSAQSSVNLWVSTYPFFESTLLFSFEEKLQAVGPVPVQILFFDPDGSLFNEVQIELDPTRTGLLELEPFMGGCKLEAGLKHAHVEVRSLPGVRTTSRIHASTGACIMGAPCELTSRHSAFFPVLMSAERSPLMVLVNRSNIEAAIRLRLYCAKRMPEMQTSVPAHGARLVSVATDFPEFVPEEGARGVPAYLRISCLNGAECGVQLLDLAKQDKGQEVFTSVS